MFSTSNVFGFSKHAHCFLCSVSVSMMISDNSRFLEQIHINKAFNTSRKSPVWFHPDVLSLVCLAALGGRSVLHSAVPQLSIPFPGAHCTIVRLLNVKHSPFCPSQLLLTLRSLKSNLSEYFLSFLSALS